MSKICWTVRSSSRLLQFATFENFLKTLFELFFFQFYNQLFVITFGWSKLTLYEEFNHFLCKLHVAILCLLLRGKFMRILNYLDTTGTHYFGAFNLKYRHYIYLTIENILKCTFPKIKCIHWYFWNLKSETCPSMYRMIIFLYLNIYIL